MNTEQMKKILEDEDIVSPMEDCTQLGIIINFIKYKKKKVILYGGGQMGRLTVKYLKKYGMNVDYIIDIDTEKSGTYIENVKIIDLESAKRQIVNGEQYLSFITLGRNYYDQYHISIEKFLDELEIPHYYFEDIWNRIFRSYCVIDPVQYADDFSRIYNLMTDLESKETLLEFIRCSLKNDSWLNLEHMCTDKYWGCDMEGRDVIYQHLDNEVWLNCGSCIGDTIFNYLGKGYHYEKIYAVEGNKNSFVKLLNNIELLGDDNKNIELINQYIGDEEGQFNMKKFFQDRKITLMNADIEGAEMDVLKAAEDVIIMQKPVIAFCVYHHFEDIINFTNYLRKIQPDYHFYLRKYASGVYNRFMNEVVLYAVPTNRLIQG
jgi:hypothetical protein